MGAIGRVTVTLPQDLVLEIDRLEKNRSRFIAEAVRHEVERRTREELLRSLQNPHPESAEFEELGLSEWFDALPQEDSAVLVDRNVGTPVRWVEGEGWVEDKA